MRVIVPHHTTKEEARKKIDQKLGELLGQYGHYLSESKTDWNGDRLDFSGKARGFSANGSVEITDDEIIIDGKLPLLAKPFESRIRHTIEREAESMFGGA